MGGPMPASRARRGRSSCKIVIEDVMSKLNASHREVSSSMSSTAAGQRGLRTLDGMKPDNVAQIASRFRKALRAALEAGAEESAA